MAENMALLLESQSVDETGTRILDAALAVMLRFGVKRTTMESVAREANVSHMTVKRRWPRKDGLLIAVLMREAQRLFDDLDTRIAKMQSSDDRAVEGFATIYMYFRTHPLLGHMLKTEPETVLPALTTSAEPGLRWATAYLAQHIRFNDKPGETAIEDPEEAAELIVRICHSLILTPRLQRPIDTEEAARDYARRVLIPLLAARR